MHSISKEQQRRRLRPAEPQLCRLSCSIPEKTASKSSKIKRRKIEKLKSAAPKSASPHAGKPRLSESQLAETLLRDIRAIFRSKKVPQLRTQEILDALAEKKLWSTLCSGKAIGARQLAKLLKRYGISSRDLRFKTKAYKGYTREWFLEVHDSK